ncbi:hypothetical protein Tco_0139903 [Tanacetum coccineum]
MESGFIMVRQGFGTSIWRDVRTLAIEEASYNKVFYPSRSGTIVVLDEAVHKKLGDSLVSAATTASSLEADVCEAFVGFFWEAKHQHDRLMAFMDLIGSKRARLITVGGSYLLGGAIDGSKANGIIRDPKLELKSSHFTFDLVPLSYESVDVVDECLEKGKSVDGMIAGVARVHGDDVAKTVFRMRNGHVEVYGYAFWVNQCTSGFHGVNEPGGVRVAREDDRGVTEGREDVREVFQQRGSGAKRKLSRCGRNQMGNEPILALPEGADDFVVYYDARSKDLEACLEKGRSEFDFEAKYHLGKANVDVVPWSRKKE